MSKKIYQIRLSEQERHACHTMIHSGHHAARMINRARILLFADAGKSDPAIAESVGVCKATVFNVRRRYCTQGHQAAMTERKRPGPPRRFTGRDEANVTVLACTDPPEGRQRWTIRLLADKVVELGTVDSVSPTTVHTWLKKTT